MLRLCLLISLPLILIFSLFSGAIITFSTTQTPQPALEGFMGCVFPCWYGMSLQEVYAKSSSTADFISLSGYQYQQTVEDTYSVSYLFTAPGLCDLEDYIQWHVEFITLNLTHCPDLRLGDLLPYMGNPDLISLNGTMFMYFRRTGESIFVNLHTQNWFSWLTPVDSIVMTTGGVGGADSFEWEGMKPRSVYCLHQPLC